MEAERRRDAGVGESALPYAVEIAPTRDAALWADEQASGVAGFRVMRQVIFDVRA
jgi:hypothetical protein